ncbi:discoidin domain-containing protein [Blastococcus sp. LR1]|uniref:discoidin domain-containing protein n=1 Tax=Blastococcus sp. LR1 TaxID=2877000 RepID=UPI001CCB2CC5|nr:discoidin domain-containing protein [Blastococcus sp. LR1]MCA0144893.1 discoidin domain-containing protein [Blastococcus sp. LR1]
MSSYDGKQPRTAPWVPQAAPPEPAWAPQPAWTSEPGVATATTPQVSLTKEQPQVGPWAGPPPVHPFPAPPPQPPAHSGRSSWLVLVALLLVGAMGAGAWFVFGASDDDNPSVVADGGPAVVVPAPDQKEEAEPRPDRPVGSLRPEFVSAGCQALPGEDSVGNTITYEPAHTLDGVPGTAWRCPGSAEGQRVAFDFGREVTLTSVGLIPGYAKVDPFDGTDRFLENRTITRVVWEFDDGTTQVQTFSPPRPSLDQIVLDAPVTTEQVVVEIVTTGNETAVRDFTAISEVAFEGY